MNTKIIKNNPINSIYTKKIKSNNFIKPKIKSKFFKVFNQILKNKIKKNKNEFINIEKIKLNKISKKNNHDNYQSYKNECIELNQEGLWIKTLIQIRKKLISSYQEIINMQI